MLMNSQYYDSVLARAKQAFKASNDAELSRALGISRQTIAMAKKRDTIPYKSIIEKIIEFEDDISLDWIFGNTGCRRWK